MSAVQIDPSDAEWGVGGPRQADQHLFRLRSEEGRWYMLHSTACIEERPLDLVNCPISLAAEKLSFDDWIEDMTMVLVLTDDGTLTGEPWTT